METLIVEGSLECLGKIAEYVISAATKAGLEEKASYKLRLAVDEIATNIITHGYEETGLEGKITVQAKIDDESLTIYIECGLFLAGTLTSSWAC